MSLFRLLFNNLKPLPHNIYRARNVSYQKNSFQNEQIIENTDNQSNDTQDQRFSHLDQKILKQQNFDKKEYLKSQQEQYTNKQRKSKYSKLDNSTTKFYTDENIQKILLNTQSAQRLFQLYKGHKFTFSLQNMVHLLTKYAKIRYLKINNERKNVIKKGDTQMQSLLFSLQSNIHLMTNFEKVIVLWSLSKLSIEDNLNDLLIDDLFKQLTDNKDALTFQEIALITWSLAKRNVRNIKFLKEICNNLLLKLSNEKLQIVQIIDRKLPATDKQQTKEQDIYDSIDQEISKDDAEPSFLEDPVSINQQILPEFQVEAQSLSIILWSFGSLKIKDSTLLKTIIKKISQQIDKFSIRMISQVFYTMGIFHMKINSVYQIIVDRLLSLQDDLKLESVLTLKILLVGLAKCQVHYQEKDHRLAISISSNILTRNEKQPLSPRFTSEILYRLSVADYYDPHIYQKFMNNVVININQMNIKDVVWCFFSFCKHDHQRYSKVLILLIQRMEILKHKLEKEGIQIIEKVIEKTQYQNKMLSNILNSTKIKQNKIN